MATADTKPRASTATPPRPTPKQQPLATRARGLADDANERFADGVEANPLAVLAGGVAVGLLAGALIPKSKLEGDYLGPLGVKLNEGAVTAAKAAREAGKAELAAVGLSKVGANEQVGKLLDGLGKALTSAGSAARETRKRKDAAANG